MDLTLDGILTDLLITRLRGAKLGIVVRGIRDLRPVPVAEEVALTLQRSLAVAVVGYPLDGHKLSSSLELAQTIEAAVTWRNQSSSYAGRMLVFVPGDVDKLGSLHSLDEVTTRDLSLHLLEWVARYPDTNVPRPQRRFWEGLRPIAATLPFSRLLDFVTVVQNAPRDPEALPRELWRLGLLEDQALLDTDANIVDRIERNRALILAIAQLSDRSRKRMNQVLQRATGPQHEGLREAARKLRSYFARNERELLRGLQFRDVERLIEAGKIDPVPVPLSTPNEEEPTPSPDQGSRVGGVLRGQDLAAAVAGQIVSGQYPESVAAYTDLVRRQMRGDESIEHELSDEEVLHPIAHGRTIVTSVRSQTRKLWSFVGSFCTSSAWGGVIVAEQHNLRDVVQRFTPGAQVELFDPRAAVYDGPGLVGLLQNIETELEQSPGLLITWEQMEVARAELVLHLDVLIAEPIALLYSDLEAQDAMERYLDSYTAFLERLHTNGPTLMKRFQRAYRAILQGILRLDVIFVHTPAEQTGHDSQRRWKALLTPLHPLHLWRYRSILERAGPQLTSEQQEQLTQSLPKLPHLLHFVATNDPQLGRITLPQAGSLESLPIYENRTNRYLGNDGVEFLGDLLRSWLAFAPYSQRQIRLALIDVPYLPDALREIREFLVSRSQMSVVVDAYRTRPQNILEHLAEMEFDGQDSSVAELMLANRLNLNMFDCKSLHEVTDRIKARPVHIMYAFDQSSYDLTQAARHRHLIVSPLVVTYEYSYDSSYKRGDIEPSSDAESGLFSVYHKLLYQAIDLQEDQSFHVQIGRGNDVDALNQILVEKGSQWLVVADRTMLGYAPLEAVPLLEELRGRREIGVWSHATSRSIRQFNDLLLTFRLQPDESHMVRLMQRYGHIASGGLFSTVRSMNGSVQQRERQQKGLVGTVLAAYWYTSQYPGALIASLDSGLARQWLAVQGRSFERADLVGLRVGGSSELIIDVIEVKTGLQSQSEVRVTVDPRGFRLSGNAISQLQATLQTITPIFLRGVQEPDLFTHARREALKYQLYRECFRELHADTEQARWYALLNQAFRDQGSDPATTIHCHGTVVQVLLDEYGDDEVIDDVNGVMSLVRLRTRSLQRLISPISRRSELPPTNPSQPQPSSSDSPSDPSESAQLSTHELPTTAASSQPELHRDSPSMSRASVQHQIAEHPEHASGEVDALVPQLDSGIDQSSLPTSIAGVAPIYDVLLGDTTSSRQFGILGHAGRKLIALDLNGTNTISLFGVQGGGKSYTLGTIVEMATGVFPGINTLPSPLASVIFHYHDSQDYPPEFVSMQSPNTRSSEIQALLKEYGARPGKLDDVVILVPRDKLAERQAEFPSVRVESILFSSNELSLKDWRFLMGVEGNQMYMQQVRQIMRQLRTRLTIDTLQERIEDSDLSESQKGIVRVRLNFARDFIDDSRQLSDILQSGRMIIVDVRDEFIDKDEALGLFVVMLNIFANAGREQSFNKLIVFDEAHKYMSNVELTDHIVDVIRQMRHQGVSVLIASQDPPSLPQAIIELSSLVILHRFNSPKWLKHVQQAVTALSNLTPAQLANLQPGEAYVWATKATDNRFTQQALKMIFRPRVTQHGGGTKTAL